jgi:glycine cleavage system H protein
MVPDDRYYTQEHEWVQVEDETGVVGITEHAAAELGDIVFVELPDVGSEFNQGDAVGTIESVKAVADLYSPVSGEVVAVNGEVTEGPELVNSSPLDQGWLFKIRLSDPEELEKLLDAAGYQQLLGG